jgi:hypothetical protein
MSDTEEHQKMLGEYIKNMFKAVVYWGSASDFLIELHNRIAEYRKKDNPVESNIQGPNVR